MNKSKVIVIGGGVAGMSTAHELVKRGYLVEIYETRSSAGGKAKSVHVADSATNGKKPLPGEHGFRFFPKFYQHVTATMKEIPFGTKTVFDNLVQTTEIRVARFDTPSFFLPARFPTSITEIKKFLTLSKDCNLDLTEHEKEYFAERVWQLMTSCNDRRKNEYERVGWWEFVEANRYSDSYRTFLAKGLTRTLVAARAEKVSTKTGGDVLLQLFFDIMKPGTSSDRILNGPTNDAWIDPWRKHLEEQGVTFVLNAKATAFNCKGEAIESVTIEQDNHLREVRGDYYVSAVPVEVMASLLNHDMLYIDPTLETIKELANHVSWMNGLQLYLSHDVQINHGHTIYIDTPWALTSISQAQFWENFKWEDYGDGEVKSILSVDISDWFTPGILYGKPASQCTTTEIAEECWAQIKKSLNINGAEILKDSYLHKWNLDSSIVPGVPTVNLEPLLVNDICTWDLRPPACTGISNFFLAADYVKTNTDLATMEGANEAAKRAVNGIINATGHSRSYCKIHNMHEPFWLTLFRFRDRGRYNKGLPWNGKIPFGVSTLTKIAKSIISLF